MLKTRHTTNWKPHRTQTKHRHRTQTQNRHRTPTQNRHRTQTQNKHIRPRGGASHSFTWGPPQCIRLMGRCHIYIYIYTHVCIRGRASFPNQPAIWIIICVEPFQVSQVIYGTPTPTKELNKWQRPINLMHWGGPHVEECDASPPWSHVLILSLCSVPILSRCSVSILSLCSVSMFSLCSVRLWVCVMWGF